MRLARAVDLWMGDLARAGRQKSSRLSYERYLHKLVDQVERRSPDADVRDVTTDPAPAPRGSPAYVVDVSRAVKPWRWTSVLLAPLELLALAWGAPVLILLIMLPIGLALVGVLWLGRFLAQVF